MKDGKISKDDIFLGGILINPKEVFTMTTEPVLKGWKRDLYIFCKEKFLSSGDVDVSLIYPKLKEKYPWLTIENLMDVADVYVEYRNKKLADRKDYGQPYCPYPREIDSNIAEFLMGVFSEEDLAKLQPSLVTRTEWQFKKV